MESPFILSQADGRAMYLQIIEQIKNKIALGDWPQGYKLPSIRELAVALKVSVITVKRAYQELENEQVIYTQQGKGSFVADGENIGLKMKQQELDEHLNKALVTAKFLGMDVKELSERLSQLAQTKRGNEDE
jgi:GntR family transcriptional regulator